MAYASPTSAQWIIDHWGQADEPSEGLARWPTSGLRDVQPVACHSHNDYWRSVPLYSAIQAGCTSVEADVWLVENDLYVGHTESSLTPRRTLRSLYIQPLLELINGSQTPIPGVFDADPSQPLVLLVDFKTPGAELWPELVAQLSPLRERGLLTHFNGTTVIQRVITVVATGNAPFDLIRANQSHRDIFYDAPLDQLSDSSQEWPNPNRVPEAEKAVSNALSFSSPVPGLRPAHDHDLQLGYHNGAGSTKPATSTAALEDGYTWQNSYLGSTSFNRDVGPVWGSRLSQRQLQILRSHIRGAHSRGLKVRYWDLPYWPVGLRNHVWHVLIREGADLLSVDDLPGATRTDWRRKRGWWSKRI
ncbi:MAG: hypothetical protein L6R39_003017 [Caloplaca ligustica]|nr:MAG: hypothetical protein L6R39_003017 [Caloplaca ligustica]